jgi:hypothetical protein
MEYDMANGSIPKKVKNSFKNAIPYMLVLLLLVGVPMLFLNYQAKHSGMSWGPWGGAGRTIGSLPSASRPTGP